jgi:hypothetical protein
VSDRRFLPLGLVALALVSLFSATAAAQGNSKIQHVLLISIDGMHAVDFYNCSHGIAARMAGVRIARTWQH